MTTTLPTGILTFLFTDIEGSTPLLERVGADEYAHLLGVHHQTIRDTVASEEGFVVMSEGDAFFVVFTDQAAAVRAAVAVQGAIAGNPDLQRHGLLVRMGLHTDQATLGGDNYVGMGVHIAARISAASHGGQILVSDSTALSLEAQDATMRLLGTYWLKDITTPVSLYQVVGLGLPDGFPPVAASPTKPHNAPALLSTFVGRDADVERGLNLLESARLVTLTGPGGTGKTRLSLAIGSALTNRFKHGVFFVPLAGITEAAGVVTGMLDALAAPAATGTTSPDEYLGAYLANRETLLVVDNFEQVLDAAGTLVDVLAASTGTRILVTSRIPLGLAGEQEMHIEPLVQSLAVELFIDRASSVQQGFEVDDVSREAIEEIVRRLDGLPLAIELAAARVRMMTARQIADTLTPLTLAQRTAGTPAHQQTLNDTIRWSYDLLSAAEQRLLMRLSVFIGGAALDEVVAVCDPSAIGLDPIAGLDALVTQNLLVADRAGEDFRVRMLETIREFGLVMLGEIGERDEMFSRHVSAYLELAESATPQHEGPESIQWMDRLTGDHANIEAALTRAVTSGDGERAQRLIAALWRYWQSRGHLVTGQEHATRALATKGAPIDVRARALDAAGNIAYWRGDIAVTRSFYENALEAHRSNDDPAGIANALYNLSFPVADQGDTDESRVLLEEAKVLLEQQGNIQLLSATYTAIARSWMYEDADKMSEAAALSIQYSQQLGETMDLAWAHSIHGSGLFYADDFDAALEEHRRALTIFMRYQDIGAMTIGVTAVAETARKVGDIAAALYLAGGVATLWKTSGTGLITPHDVSLADFISPESIAALPQKLQDRFEQGVNASLDDIVVSALGYRIPGSSSAVEA